MKRSIVPAVCAVAFLLMPAAAQTPLPPVEAFAMLPALSDPSLSPDGQNPAAAFNNIKDEWSDYGMVMTSTDIRIPKETHHMQTAESRIRWLTEVEKFLKANIGN
jgi:hypothetical protein